MPIFQTQVVFPMFTNLPQDVFVNRFHFLGVGISHADAATQINTRLKAFYDGIYGAAATARVNYVDWQLAVTKTFNLDDPPTRIPEVRNLGYGLAGTASTQIPTEVAIVASFHAAPSSGVRFQRLYNRIYLGMLRTSDMSASATDGFPILNNSTVVSVNTQMQQLKNANTVALQWRQVSNAGGVLVDRNITGGWTDNSPDTQRRRSVLATARNNWVPL